MRPSEQFTDLYESIKRRKRPEDVAQLILETPEIRLGGKERAMLQKVSKGSLKKNWFGFTSMSEDFASVVGCQGQLKTGFQLFPDLGGDDCHGEIPEDADRFLREASPSIGKAVNQSDFLKDRLNKIQRKEIGLEISKRQYNKRFRYLRRLERKRDTMKRELKKRYFTLVSKSRLASEITEDDFYSSPYSAAFIAYYTARCNLRSIFTAGKQDRPYDQVADSLFSLCTVDSTNANWWALAHVFPDPPVLSRLNDVDKGKLLGKYYSLLCDIAQLLEEVWRQSEINRATMIVRLGNDSTTWNNTAGAWNKARDSWFRLLYSMGLDEIIETLCPGKVLRLMAADVAAWHRSMGGDLESDTGVWCALPLPWEVLSGKSVCTKSFVENVCHQNGVDPIKKGWVAPPPERKVARYRPTPELVHGVTVAHPGLAIILKSAGFFSGKNIKI